MDCPVKFTTLTTLADRSFAAAAPRLWTSLPYAIRSSPSVAPFKKTLKTFLFQKAFLQFYVLFNLVISRFYAVFTIYVVPTYINFRIILYKQNAL